MFRSRQQLCLSAALIATSLFFGCNNARTEQPDSSSHAEPSIRYVRAVRRQVPESLRLEARVQVDPTRWVRIFPPASGRVTAIRVKPGDRVARGQVVALLDSSDVASARSDFAKAKIEADRSTRALEREKLLYEHGAAAEKDYIDARAQSDGAQAELVRARQRLELFHASADSAEGQIAITTPISGIVLDLATAPGEFSRSLDAANPLVTVADLATVWILGDAYERDMEKLHPGTPVTITVQAYPGRTWRGVIGPISGALDPVTRTLKVRVSVRNPDLELRPEMFGSIELNVGTRSALVVPAVAIIREGNHATVFVKNEGKPEQREVTVGQTIDGMVEVLDGLREGDEVAADGAELLKGGPEV